MAERTDEQVMDQVVYAVACAAQHYGPGLSHDGLYELREVLERFSVFHTDASYRVDVRDDEEWADFHERIFWPYDEIDFNAVKQQSKEKP